MYSYWDINGNPTVIIPEFPHKKLFDSKLFPISVPELHTENCPFADLPEKRRTLYSLTRDEMQNCQ
jgi:hypothetical protein